MSSSMHDTLQSVVDEQTSSIITTLLYFDIFRFPLRAKELWHLHGLRNISELEFYERLQYLVQHRMIHEHDGWYFVHPDSSIIDERHIKQQRAGKYYRIATMIARFIHCFPFVRAVFLSGSLSKCSMDVHSDLDYFLIVEPNRLWFSRTLLMLFKKCFLLNSHKYFCINYYVDTKSLFIPDHNIFTAMEIAYVLPVVNAELYHNFIHHNHWIYDYFPHYQPRSTANVRSTAKGNIKTCLEWLLNGTSGDWLDDYCFRHTRKRWKTKFFWMNEEEFELALRSTKHVSKHHPQNFQRVVLEKLEARKREFEAEHHIHLV